MYKNQDVQEEGCLAPWRWYQYVVPKRRCETNLRCVTSQKTTELKVAGFWGLPKPLQMLKRQTPIVLSVWRLATGWAVRGSNAGRKKICLLQNRQDRLQTYPSLLFNGHVGSFPVIQRPRSEVGHSSTPSAEIKNEWSYTSAPSTCIHSVDWNNFTLVTVTSLLWTKSNARQTAMYVK